MIRKLALVLFLACALGAQAKFIADPIVRYKIDARLDAQKKTVKGHEVIVWKNHTAESVPDLQFHLYLNAFKNNLSTFMQDNGTYGRRVSFRKTGDAWGYEQVHSLKVDGHDLTAAMQFIHPDDGNVNDQTVMRVPLATPVGPGQSVTIEIDWTSQLPHVFARTGFHDNFFLVAQWFPKPGVYEARGERHRPEAGWNCHQFHASTEFFADYGTFDVNLTVPADFVIAATGAMRSSKSNPDGTVTYNYYQEDVHDFAWTTQPKSQALKIVRTFKADQMVSPAEIAEWSKKTDTPPDQVRLQDVQVTLFIQREHSGQIDRHFRAVFNALKWFGLFYGKYPYDVLTFVDPPYGGMGAGGMEYPTFFTAGTSYWPAEHALSPEGVIVHEFGHQFWYGLVGNNEFEEAWLDEGFNSYSTAKVLERAYGPNYFYNRIQGLPIPGASWTQMAVPNYPWYGVDKVRLGQYWEWVPVHQFGPARDYADSASSDVMERYAWLYLNRDSYRVQAYTKPELTLATLEGVLGEAWPKVIRTYQQRYRFKHPDAIDFMDTVREVSGQDMKWFFDQTVYGTGQLNYAVSFTNEKPPAKHGYFDQAKGPALVEPAEEKGEGDKKPSYESELLVRRLGEMQFPLKVKVRFADGTQMCEKWDGQYRWIKFKYSNKAKIVSAELDPDYTWKIEMQRTDDSYVDRPVQLAAEKWYLRWVVWIQNVLMAFSFFS